MLAPYIYTFPLTYLGAALCSLQSGDWLVFLEGLCRISIEDVASRSATAFDTVTIQQLELKPGSSNNGWTGHKSDQQLLDLSKQLKVSTRQLLKLLSQQTGLPAVKRLLELLDAVPAWRAADVVSAALGMNVQVGHKQHAVMNDMLSCIIIQQAQNQAAAQSL